MSKLEKLFDKAKNHPSGLSFEEFKTLMNGLKWIEDRQKGSHQIWYSPKMYRISIQNFNGKAKGYQVKQFLMQVEREENNE